VGNQQDGRSAVGEERLSRFLARSGVASRRHVDALIAEGRVTVNGKLAVLGQKVRPAEDRVFLDGREVGGAQEPVYIILNKPPGYLSTCADPRGRRTVMSLLEGVSARVFPVGRLDYDAEGLLIMTNDGELAYLLTHPKHKVIKEYVVTVAGPRDESKIQRILSGIIIGGKRVQADYARFQGGDGRPLTLVIGVHEGQKHLVKHICRSVGYTVKRLIRVKVGPLCLGSLDRGAWRYLTPREVKDLYAGARNGWEGERKE
jgi:23S rRNA pseudouridine2605 synthase